MDVQALCVNSFSLHGCENGHHAHLILNGVRLRSINSVGIHLILDFDVQVAVIPGVWCTRKRPSELFPCRDRDGILGIEDGLPRKETIK